MVQRFLFEKSRFISKEVMLLSLGFAILIASLTYCSLSYCHAHRRASQNDGYIPTCLTSSCFLEAEINEDNEMMKKLLENDKLEEGTNNPIQGLDDIL